jgi:hypothetical protein
MSWWDEEELSPNKKHKQEDNFTRKVYFSKVILGPTRYRNAEIFPISIFLLSFLPSLQNPF